jgi:hypothetical protein
MDDKNVPTDVGFELLLHSHFLPNRGHNIESKLLLFHVLTKKDKNSGTEDDFMLYCNPRHDDGN